jgi:tetratricopeptide (TPR) repeat protein
LVRWTDCLGDEQASETSNSVHLDHFLSKFKMSMSTNDQQILDIIFNNDMASINELNIKSVDIDETELIKLKQLEVEAILASQTNIEKGLELISKAIELHPKYASAYNNRAQLFRLKNQYQNALEDLDRAVEYGDFQVLKQAYTHRAIVKQKLGLAHQQDFEKGAQFGNDIAKEQVKNNPISKLCIETLLHLLNATQ